MSTVLFGFGVGFSFSVAYGSWKQGGGWVPWVLLGIIFWAGLLYV